MIFGKNRKKPILFYIADKVFVTVPCIVLETCNPSVLTGIATSLPTPTIQVVRDFWTSDHTASKSGDATRNISRDGNYYWLLKLISATLASGLTIREAFSGFACSHCWRHLSTIKVSCGSLQSLCMSTLLSWNRSCLFVSVSGTLVCHCVCKSCFFACSCCMCSWTVCCIPSEEGV